MKRVRMECCFRARESGIQRKECFARRVDINARVSPPARNGERRLGRRKKMFRQLCALDTQFEGAGARGIHQSRRRRRRRRERALVWLTFCCSGDTRCVAPWQPRVHLRCRSHPAHAGDGWGERQETSAENGRERTKKARDARKRETLNDARSSFPTKTRRRKSSRRRLIHKKKPPR